MLISNMPEFFSIIWEWFWIVLAIGFIVWTMKVYFNEKEIKERDERVKKFEAEKRTTHIETKLIEAEGRIRELELENKLLRVRIRELEE